MQKNCKNCLYCAFCDFKSSSESTEICNLYVDEVKNVDEKIETLRSVFNFNEVARFYLLALQRANAAETRLRELKENAS